MKLEFVLAFRLFFLVGLVHADDWPQWRGPLRDGTSKETGLLKEWPAAGPKLLWKITDLGNGYSSFSVVGENLYTLSNEGMENEYVQARSVNDGKRLWQTRLGNVGTNIAQANYAAARSTPTVDGEYLYALSSGGDLASIARTDGKPRWHKNLRADFAGKPGLWAYAESPLIDGDALICTPGGSEATLVALNKYTGAVLWKCASPETDEAAFSSVIVLNSGGTKQYVQLLSKGLVGIDANSGKLLWRYSKPVSKFAANIPTPVAGDDYIYAAAAGTGGGAVHLAAKDGQFFVEEAYFSAKNPTAIGGVIRFGDYLYGTTGSAMQCLKFKTGELVWEDRALAPASMCYADSRLYLHGENGDVALVEPSPEGYHPKGRFTPPDQPGPTRQMEKSWAYPVVANGRLYIREHAMLWCYDARAK
ncbi:MAG TPA: PQQ-binding-like beta-propeller repeat protein [Verrucomicrobiae bacterium]|jgi:outer membrane protein assembly factor BamB|nr:PQQ-binding-like beta-propeller repeat protein [Verrucomicrobiae bacterium]